MMSASSRVSGGELCAVHCVMARRAGLSRHIVGTDCCVAVPRTLCCCDVFFTKTAETMTPATPTLSPATNHQLQLWEILIMTLVGTVTYLLPATMVCVLP